MKDAVLRPAPDLAWVVETRGLTLVRRRGGAFASIPYPHAGLWAILADGSYTPERARNLLALLLSIDEKAAERELVQTLAAWQEAGLIVIS